MNAQSKRNTYIRDVFSRTNRYFFEVKIPCLNLQLNLKIKGYSQKRREKWQFINIWKGFIEKYA